MTLTDKFLDRCGIWINATANWLSQPTSDQAVFQCADLATDSLVCGGGLGDRLASLVSAFNVAMHERRAYRVSLWPGIANHFESCLLNFSVAGRWNDPVDTLPNPHCKPSIIHTCRNMFDSNSNCTMSNSGSRFISPNRLCTPPAFCQNLRMRLPDVNVADSFGCPLRLVMAPQLDFLSKLKFDFRDGNQVASKTISEIQSLLNQYFVIAVHLRLGDFAFRRERKSRKTGQAFNDVWQNPLRCAQTLEAYLVDGPRSSSQSQLAPTWNLTLDEFKGPGKRIAGKEVKWMIFTDNDLVRDLTLDLLQDRIVRFEQEPEHLHFLHPSKLKNETMLRRIEQQLWAEWYVLGLADKLIMSDWHYVGSTFLQIYIETKSLSDSVKYSE